MAGVRTAHSFDPCLARAVHVIVPDRPVAHSNYNLSFHEPAGTTLAGSEFLLK
jgi:hypothetical protein